MPHKTGDWLVLVGPEGQEKINLRTRDKATADANADEFCKAGTRAVVVPEFYDTGDQLRRWNNNEY